MLNHVHHLFGRRLRVPFAAPWGPGINGAWDHEVVVVRGVRRPWQTPTPMHGVIDEHGWRLSGVAEHGAWVKAHGNPSSGVITVETSESDHDVAVALASSFLPAVLVQSRQAIWHGSALRCRGASLLVMGHSGRGKSTVSAGLIGRGWALVSEDVTVLTTDGRPVPGIPALRMAVNSLLALGYDPASLASVFSPEFDDGKRWLPVPVSRDADPMPALSAVVVLGPRASRREPAERLSKPEAFAVLMAHRYRVRGIPDHPENHTRQAAWVATHVPVWRLSCLSSLASIDDTLEEVENMVTRL